jgi:F-type H+-transporting ATPase subunit alpha
MAWLVAFNEGLFDGMDLAEIPGRLSALQVQVRDAGLDLDDERNVWVTALREWLRP